MNLRKLTPSLLFLLLCFSCQNEEPIEVNISEKESSFNKVATSDDDQAQFLASQLVNVNARSFAGTSLDSVVYYEFPDSNIRNYAFLTSEKDNIDEISNVVFVYADSVYVGYEVVYEPSEGHYDGHPGGHFLGGFTGLIRYKSLQTGDVFLTLEFENGEQVIPKYESARRMGEACYPDEANKIECTVRISVNQPREKVYQSTDPQTGKKVWVYRKTGEPVPSVDIWCKVDTDYSSCNLTYFNTNGYTTFPQWYDGASSGSLVASTNPVAAPPNISIEERIISLWESNQIALTDNFINNPCAMSVFEDLMNGPLEGSDDGELNETNVMYNALNFMMEDAFDLKLAYVLDIQDDPCDYNKKYGITANACTDHRQENHIPTVFSSNYVSSASSMSIARTMLHEAIHAQLIYYYKVQLKIDEVDWSFWPDLWAYVKANPGIGKWQHEAMAERYRGAIEKGLRDFARVNNLRFSNQFFSDMAWGGLSETSAYDALSDSDKIRIDDLINDEGKKGGCP